LRIYYGASFKEKDMKKSKKAQRMMLGLAIGDAFGRNYEGKSRFEVEEKFDLTEYRHNQALYTDDTQMAIAVAELMVSHLDFSEEALASNFVYAFRRDKRRGYSSRTRESLEKAYCGKDFLDQYHESVKKETNSNGSVMRVMPIGLFKGIKDVIRYSRLNSEITHGHPEAIYSCIAVALLSHGLYYNKCSAEDCIRFILKNIRDLPPDIKKYFEEIDKLKDIDYKVLLKSHYKHGLPCNALKTVGVVLFIIKKYHNNPSEALKQSILIGGDVDSSASLTLGAVLINNEIRTLPKFLFNGLENKKYGKDYLIKLGDKLSEKFKTNERHL